MMNETKTLTCAECGHLFTPYWTESHMTYQIHHAVGDSVIGYEEEGRAVCADCGSKYYVEEN